MQHTDWLYPWPAALYFWNSRAWKQTCGNPFSCSSGVDSPHCSGECCSAVISETHWMSYRRPSLDIRFPFRHCGLYRWMSRWECFFIPCCSVSVSYTHLDVYKRQGSDSRPGTGNPEHLCSGEKRHAGFPGRQAAGRERTVWESSWKSGSVYGLSLIHI